MSMRPIRERQESNRVGEGELRISSDYLILLLELGVELGLKQGDLLSGSGLGADILFSRSISVGHLSFLTVVSNFIALRSDLSLAVVYGKRMTLFKHGALGIAARHSRTIEAAAGAVTSYMKTRAEIFSIRRERDEGSRRLYVELEVEPSAAVYFMVLAYLTSTELIIRQMLENPAEIETTIELPIECSIWKNTALNTHSVCLDEEAPGAMVHFSRLECVLSWPVSFLHDLLPLFDKDLVMMAEEACESEMENISQSLSVKQIVENEFKQAEGVLPTIEGVALKLNMSPATLKRRMKDEGVSFRGIKDDIFHKRARKLLKESSSSIEIIAEQLGYSDPSNFSKAFKSWSGFSPSEYRHK